MDKNERITRNNWNWDIQWNSRKLEQFTPVDYVKGFVRNPNVYHMKEYKGRNVVNVTIKTRTIVRIMFKSLFILWLLSLLSCCAAPFTSLSIRATGSDLKLKPSFNPQNFVSIMLAISKDTSSSSYSLLLTYWSNYESVTNASSNSLSTWKFHLEILSIYLFLPAMC